jgi:hypothetical protein
MLNAQIKNLGIVFLVPDLVRSHRFYAETLGLVAACRGGPGHPFIPKPSLRKLFWKRFTSESHNN